MRALFLPVKSGLPGGAGDPVAVCPALLLVPESLFVIPRKLLAAAVSKWVLCCFARLEGQGMCTVRYASAARQRQRSSDGQCPGRF